MLFKAFCRLLQQFNPLNNVELYRDWATKLATTPPLQRLVCEDEHLSRQIQPQMRARPIQDDKKPVTSPFVAPGLAARSMQPLFLPPFHPKDGIGKNELEIVSSLLRALRKTNTNLERLSLPADLYLGHELPETPMFARGCSISICNLIGRGQKQAQDQDNPLVTVFRPLKFLELRLHTQHLFENHRGGESQIVRGWLPKAIQSMGDVEELALAFEYNIEFNEDSGITNLADYELFKLMLEKKVNYGAEFTCHRHESETTDPTNMQNASLFVSERRLTEQMEFHYQRGENRELMEMASDPSRQLRILHPCPWPKLVRLTLSNMKATQFDLASLLISVAPTLRDLTLDYIRLGLCPCSRRRRTSFLDLWPVGGIVSSRGAPHVASWFNALTMMAKVLTLDKCVIFLHPYDSEAFIQELAKFMKLKVAQAMDFEVLDQRVAEYVCCAQTGMMSPPGSASISTPLTIKMRRERQIFRDGRGDLIAAAGSET